MLPGHRVFLANASNACQCICREGTAASLAVASGRLQSFSHSPFGLNTCQLSANMHTDCPCPPSTGTSAPTSKWKRGRPIYSYTRRRTFNTLPSTTTSASDMLDLHTQVKAKRHSEGHACPQLQRSDDVEKVARDAMQRLSLYDRSTALRFSPTPPMKSIHSTNLAGGSMDYHTKDIGPYQTSRLVDAEGNAVEESVHLSYNIPEDVLRATMSASPNTRNSYWSAQLYRGPNEERIKVHYCSDMAIAEKVAEYFMEEKVLGFDIEWKPQGSPKIIKHNVSLIQLACEDRIALFHIALYPGWKAEELLPPTVKKILESPEIIKVGVAVKGDFTRLSNYLSVKPQGVFELSRLHNLVEWYEKDPRKVTKKLASLAVQVHQHLQLPLYKGEQLIDEDITSSVRESDWSQELDHAQIHYAAADVYAGFRLYHVLEQKRKQMRPIPPAIALCDYDDKPSAKPKVAKKKKKAAQSSSTKPEEDEKLGTSTNADEEVEDSEDYETAQEDLVDSHELEDNESPASPASEQAEQSEAVPEVYLDSTARELHTAVGRIDLQKSRGPDLEYPELPRTDSPDDTPTIPQRIDGLADTIVQVDTAEDDGQYSDSDIDEALGTWIEHDGQLHEDMVSNTSAFEVSAPHEEEAEKDGDAQIPGIPTSPSNEQPQTVPESPHAPQYILATTWAKEYLALTIPSPSSTAPPRLHATIAPLRAYHLWHHQNMSLADIQVCLRDPPLAHNTIASYILQAVSLERLEYDEKALRAVLMSMQAGFRKGKFRGLAQKLGCA